jgi:HAE1 family hydrophobic/amphiphilic exporter-1
MFLKNVHATPHSKMTGIQKFFGGFNRWYESIADRYKKLIGAIGNRSIITFAVLLGFSVGAGLIGKSVPTGFIPRKTKARYTPTLPPPRVRPLNEQMLL